MPMAMRTPLLAAAALLLASTSTASLADTLVRNANGIQVSQDGQLEHFTGILIGNDGKVKRLLRGEMLKLGGGTKVVDARGRTVLPGLIDAHGHVLGLGFGALQLDLVGTPSLADLQRRLKAYAAANPGSGWIIGRGWTQENWAGKRFPTSADLDAVVADRPVWLERVDGHAAWANSRAIQIAGVTAANKDTNGGRIERDAKGAPAGVFVDGAMGLVEKFIPKATPRERNAAFLAAQDKLLSLGITASADMGTTTDDWLTYRRIADIGQLRMRIMSYAHGVETALQVAGQGPTPWLYGDKLRMGGIKLYADGALGSRGAWLKADYSDAPGQKGLGFLTDDQLLNLMTRGAMDNFQIAVHAIGDRANSQVLDAVEVLSDTFKDDRRWRIEHAQIVDPKDLPRFAKLGVIASMQPVHQTSDMKMAEARLGPDRLAGAYAWKTMLKDGTHIAFGSDYPVESPDPWAGWAVSFTRTDANGQPFGGWRIEEAVTREQGWAGFTTGAAWAGFAETLIGRLAPGMRADFIIVDRDPMLASPADLRGTQVLETWVGGARVYVKK
jgi:predicted amidohydrolase YtcJ